MRGAQDSRTNKTADRRRIHSLVMLRRLIIDQRNARKFAGQMTAEMIRLGASAEVMRRNNIPTLNFYGAFGGRKWERTTPRLAAIEMMDAYTPRVIFEHNVDVDARIPAPSKPESMTD
jgi:hypothetical protein